MPSSMPAPAPTAAPAPSVDPFSKSDAFAQAQQQGRASAPTPQYGYVAGAPQQPYPQHGYAAHTPSPYAVQAQAQAPPLPPRPSAGGAPGYSAAPAMLPSQPQWAAGPTFVGYPDAGLQPAGGQGLFDTGMPAAAFSALLQQMRLSPLDSQRSALWRAACAQYRLTCAQLGQLLVRAPTLLSSSVSDVCVQDVLPFQNERVVAAEALGPLVTDRKGGVVRLAAGGIRSARDELAAVLAKHDVSVQ
jgi:hypothetical protein